MKKKISLVILVGCLSMLFLNYFGNEKINAASKEVDNPETIFQSVSLSKYDSKKETVAKVPLKGGETINYDDSLQVKYHLSIPNGLEMTKDQVFSIKVPYLIPIANKPVEVKDKEGNILGESEISEDAEGSRILSFKSSDFFTKLKKREADIKFFVKLGSSIENKKQVLTFRFNTDKNSDLELTILNTLPLQKANTESDEKKETKLNEKLTNNNIERSPIIKPPMQSNKTKVAKENKAEMYSIKVNTVDADDHSIPVNGMLVLYSYDNLSEPIKTVATVNGEYTFSDLKAGKYRIAGGASEVVGYFARQGASFFEVDLPSANSTVTIEYLKGWGSVRLTKRDEDTNAVISGAEFKLVKNNADNSTEVVKEGLISTEKGIVQVNQLFSGSYSFIETKAPDGYVLESTPVNVSLKDEELVYPDPASKPIWFPTNLKTKTNKKADVTMNNSVFPMNLDFGKTKIQNVVDETFTANDNGIPTVGKIVINDTRLNGGWTLKVKQNTDFVTAEGAPLVNTNLDVTVGKVTNSAANVPSQVANLVSLRSGVENKIAVAKATEGTGTTTIPLNRFSLNVPKEANKQASEYTSSLTWTLSNVPQ